MSEKNRKQDISNLIYGNHHTPNHYYQKIIDRLISGFPEYETVWVDGDHKYVRKCLAPNIKSYTPRGLIMFRRAFILLEYPLLFSQKIAPRLEGDDDGDGRILATSRPGIPSRPGIKYPVRAIPSL